MVADDYLFAGSWMTWRPLDEPYEPSSTKLAIIPINWDTSPWLESCRSKTIQRSRVVVPRSPPTDESLMHDEMNIVLKLGRKKMPPLADSEDADADADDPAVWLFPREGEAVPVDE